MTGTFACPECGRRVGPAGVPGRQVRCPGCATLLEVPYIPRAAVPRRRSRRAARRRAAILAGVTVAIGTLVLVVGFEFLRATWRRQAEGVVAARIMEAQRAEQSGRLDEAAAAIAEAIELSHRHRIPPPLDLAARRSDLARRAAARRLESLGGLEPRQAVAAALSLNDQARDDPALDELRGNIAAALTAARARAANADLTAAERALEKGQPTEALARAAAARGIAGMLAMDEARRVREAADTLAEAVAGRYGLLAEVSGRFFLGSPAEYQDLLLRPALETLGRRGYVPAPSEPPAWRALWAGRAPTRLHLDVDEEPVPYLQSANRATKLAVRVNLSRNGMPLHSATINATTRMPPPDMAVHEAGVIATAPRRSPEVEHRLRRDALDQIRDRLGAQLNSAPPP
jgi:hypothetical protein